MNLSVSRRGLISLIVFLGTALGLFVWLMGRFGGPALELGDPYRLSAVVADSQGLARKSDVLVRGVKVGEVRAIERDGARAIMSFDLERRYAPVRSSTTLRIGQKTVLGEAYVDLVPGRKGPELRDGSRLAPDAVRPTVELDEALEALDGRAEASLQRMLPTYARGAAAPETSRRMGETLVRLRQLTTQLRGLGETLEGQGETIAGGVVDTRSVLSRLAGRERVLTELVASGRTTLEAVAAQRAGLAAGMVELPRLLRTARATLSEARPLLVEARPLLGDLRAAAPSLSAGLTDLDPVAVSARRVLRGLPKLNRTALPILARVRPVVVAARPVARLLGPTLANLVPLVRYLEPRANTLAAWFANTAAIGLNGDAKGSWVRFQIFVENGTATGIPGTLRHNAYTEPGDAADNQPYVPGAYPRLSAARP